MNSQGVKTIKARLIFSKGGVQLSDFNDKFMNKVISLFVYVKPLNLYCTYTASRQQDWCAGGRDVLNFFPLPVIG